MFSCVRRKGIGEKAPDLSRLEREGGRGGGKEEGREGELVHPDRASIRVISSEICEPELRYIEEFRFWAYTRSHRSW